MCVGVCSYVFVCGCVFVCSCVGVCAGLLGCASSECVGVLLGCGCGGATSRGRIGGASVYYEND